MKARFDLLLTVFGAASCALAAGPLLAQEEGPVEKINAEAANATISVTPLRDGLSMLSGSGGNITVLNGKEGKLLVDAGIAVSRQPIADALDAIGNGPVKLLIDTHYHWDHTDGNAWLHGLGATIIGHENTLKRMSAATRVDDWKFTFAVYPPEGRPTVLTGTKKLMTFDGTKIEIKYYGPCHTDSDVSVYFEEPNVLSTGDTFWNGVYPFIDNENGGSIDGMIRAANENVKRADANTMVVPGHGPVGSRAQLVEFRDMLVSIRKSVVDLKGRGMSLDQIIAARPTAQFDAKWGQFVIDGAFFTRLVYEGL